MGSLPLKLRHLPKYGHLGRLILAHRDALNSDEAEAARDAEQLVSELEAMGPTYVKLGQLLSSRTDLLPPAYTDALARLQDHVEPLAAGEGRRIVEDELGLRVSRAFADFEDEPMAAASLGQVHRAALRDGRPVAVKVQRPGIRHRVVEDLEVIGELAEMLEDSWTLAGRMALRGSVEEFGRSLLAELDYRQEAENLAVFGEMLADYDRIVVPAPIRDFTTAKVLTMTFVQGRALSAVGPIGLLDLDGRLLAEQLLRAYLDQILLHGVFHADPHPGNVIMTPGGQLGLVDVGMVARVSSRARDALLRLLVAWAEGKGEEVAVALERLGTKLEDYEADGLSRRVSELVVRAGGASVGELQIGRRLGELARISAESGLRTPPELTLVGKALLNLEDVVRRLDDTFQPNDVVEAHVAHLMRHRMMRAASPSQVVSAVLEGTEFAEQLPGRMNEVLDALSSGRFTLNVAGLDEKELMRGVQKLANRGATGVVVAALVLAAAVFSVSSGGPRLFGESAFTIVLLGLAFAMALWLLVGIIRSDLPQHRRPRD